MRGFGRPLRPTGGQELQGIVRARFGGLLRRADLGDAKDVRRRRFVRTMPMLPRASVGERHCLIPQASLLAGDGARDG